MPACYSVFHFRWINDQKDSDMCKNSNIVMQAISELKRDGVLSSRKAKLLRKGVPQIVEFSNLSDTGVDAIKNPILAVSRFVEKQRIMQVKTKKIAGKQKPRRKLSYIPPCLKYPEAKPFCL